MNVARLAEIKARLDAATPGPWANMPYDGVFAGEIRECEHFVTIAVMPEMDDRTADFEFIANAPEDVADLLAYVERLRDALDKIATLHPQEPHRAGTPYSQGEYAAEVARAALEATRG